MQDAIAGIEKMEDVFFTAVTKAGQAAGPLQGPWEQALAAMKMKGSDTGARANETVEALVAQARTTLRDSRASGMRAAEAMLQSYSTLVSGVLIGMAEGMRAGTGGRAPAAAPAPSPASGAAAGPRPAPRKATRRPR